MLDPRNIVTNPSTNRARRSWTLLVWPTALPLRQTSHGSLQGRGGFIDETPVGRTGKESRIHISSPILFRLLCDADGKRTSWKTRYTARREWWTARWSSPSFCLNRRSSHTTWLCTVTTRRARRRRLDTPFCGAPSVSPVSLALSLTRSPTIVHVVR